jgi:hypothetical protein
MDFYDPISRAASAEIMGFFSAAGFFIGPVHFLRGGTDKTSLSMLFL